MNKRVKKFLIALIPIKSIRHKLRKKPVIPLKVEDIGKNNLIQVPPSSPVIVRVHGNNNVIKIDSKAYINGVIEVYGDSNNIIIGKGPYTLSLFIGVPDCNASGCQFTLGKEGLINGAVIRLCEDKSSVQIGDNCLFSDQINIWASDTHTLLDAKGNILNWGHKVVIGNHVWLGCQVTVLKDTVIPDDCVVGWGSIVTKKFDEVGCVLAGNPARVVKKGISWDEKRPNQYQRMKNENNTKG